MWYVVRFLTLLLFFVLASCLDPGAADPTADEIASAGSATDLTDRVVGWSQQNTADPAAVINTSCYYAPLPGAFRIYCPGPKNADSSCRALPAGLEVSYLSGEAAAAKMNQAPARSLSHKETQALPDLCLSFDLDLLPNSSHQLSYKMGPMEYRVFSYLAFGDGSAP